MFAILNQALIAQVVLIIMATAMAYVEHNASTDGMRNSTFFRKHLKHMGAQALFTLIALIICTYLLPVWFFELKTSFPFIFGAAGVAVLTVFAKIKLSIPEASHES